jgi:hypothetical protein
MEIRPPPLPPRHATEPGSIEEKASAGRPHSRQASDLPSGELVSAYRDAGGLI